jgi:hypothetical protein
MTSKRVKSRICWIRKEAGGRESPPAGTQYSTVARFEEAKHEWPREAWSVVLEFTGPPDESLWIIADVSLLSPEAPTRLLRPGSIFELFEGHRMVARGEVL